MPARHTSVYCTLGLAMLAIGPSDREQVLSKFALALPYNGTYATRD